MRSAPARYSTLTPPLSTVTKVLCELLVVTNSPSGDSTASVTLYSPGCRGVCVSRMGKRRLRGVILIVRVSTAVISAVRRLPQELHLEVLIGIARRGHHAFDRRGRVGKHRVA